MASSTRKQCGYTNACKQAGVANCEGCSQAFCTKHFNDHRLSLNEEIEVLLSEYNRFKDTIIQEPIGPNIQPFIEEIDDWEQKSIKKIQQKAVELREELLQFKTTHIENLSANLQSLAEQIKNGHEQNDFIETDLRFWRKRLNDLKSMFSSPSAVNIDQQDDIPLVPNILVSVLPTEKNDLFDRVFNDNVRIRENGQVVTAAQVFMLYTEIRGRYGYAFGCHKTRLCIEHSSDKWMFLGINSELTPLRKSSYLSESAYGWCSSNYTYASGSSKCNKTDPAIKINKNDIITLIFDCDNRKISMINERTKIKHNLTVDINKCPFPWQLHVNFRQLGNRIRILSA